MYSNASPSLRTSPGLETVKPTDNFYLWANRQWLVKTDIPADNPRADNFTQIEDVVAAQLRELFVDIKGLKVRTAEQEKLIRLYDSFIDIKKRDARGLSPIVSVLKSIDELKTHSDLAKYFAYLATVGVKSPVLIEADSDFKDSSMNIGVIGQDGLGIEREYYLEDKGDSIKQQKLYQAYLSKLFMLAGLSDPANSANRVLDFERKLAIIQWSRVDNRDTKKVYNPTSFKAFVRESSAFYGKEMLELWGVPLKAKLCVMQPSYIKEYGLLFQGTDITILQDYARARLLTSYAVLLTSQFKSAHAQYQKDLGLVEQEEELWKQANLTNFLTNFLLPIFLGGVGVLSWGSLFEH